jgi:hemoglobin-like flavoprotein
MGPKHLTAKSRQKQAGRLRGPHRRAGLDAEQARNATGTPEHLALLRSTFTCVLAQGEIAGLIFYQKLFNFEPELRKLFHTSVELQTRKLMQSLGCVVDTFEDPEALVPVLEGLGRRHVLYGACEWHYELVTKALLETFSEVIGAAFTREARAAWQHALEFVAETMKRGAARHAASVCPDTKPPATH